MNNFLLIIISSWELKKYSNFDLLKKCNIICRPLFLPYRSIPNAHLLTHVHTNTQKHTFIFTPK